jgi:adenylate cyclase
MMNSSVNNQYRLFLAVRMVMFGMVAGVTYALFSDGPKAIMPLSNGAMIGIILGMFVAWMELYILTPALRRKLTFLQLLLLRLTVYSIVIIITLFLVFSVSRSIWQHRSYTEVLQSEEFRNYIWKEDFFIVVLYTISLALLATFTFQITRKLGQGFLLSIISGRYFKPRLKPRLFLFINLTNIRDIIRQCGLHESFTFVNDFIYDITPEILRHKGRIHHYVDNQMVIVWPYHSTNAVLKSASCFFSIKMRIHSRKAYYKTHYGIAPQVNAGLHGGTAVQGEIGVIKTEIAFYGDVINTTARIASLAGMDELLASADCIQATNIRCESCGAIKLAGKIEEMEIFRILRADEE